MAREKYVARVSWEAATQAATADELAFLENIHSAWREGQDCYHAIVDRIAELKGESRG